MEVLSHTVRGKIDICSVFLDFQIQDGAGKRNGGMRPVRQVPPVHRQLSHIGKTDRQISRASGRWHVIAVLCRNQVIILYDLDSP